MDGRAVRYWRQFTLRHAFGIIAVVALTAAQPTHVWRYSEPFFAGDFTVCGPEKVVWIKGLDGWCQIGERQLNWWLFAPGCALLLTITLNQVRRRFARFGDQDRGTHSG
ncbi:MAG: hypothetical protein AB7U73_00190 [Pirellulales bacterium]